MIKKTIVFALFITFHLNMLAQCPMCKASVESGMEDNKGAVGMGLNDGILYLMALPYVAVAAVGYFWYKSRKNQQKIINGIS